MEKRDIIRPSISRKTVSRKAKIGVLINQSSIIHQMHKKIVTFRDVSSKFAYVSKDNKELLRIMLIWS